MKNGTVKKETENKYKLEIKNKKFHTMLLKTK